MQVKAASLGADPGRGEEQEHAPQQAMIDHHVHDGGRRERQDDAREVGRLGHADLAAERQISLTRRKSTQGVHGAVKGPLPQAAAAQADQ